METQAILKRVDEIMAKYNYASEAVIPTLQEIQDEFNYLPKAALQKVSNGLKVPISQVYHIATFYRAFSLKPRGKYNCRVCLGTACHVRGGKLIKDTFERELGVKEGETTEDGLFSVESVMCVGACALGPLVVIGKQYHGNMSSKKVKSLIKKYKRQEESN